MDCELVIDKICEGLSSYLGGSGKEGGVLGISGGIDSAVTAQLAALSMGAENVHGLILPTSSTSSEDIFDAIDVAEVLGIMHEKIPVGDVVDLICSKLGTEEQRHRGNVAARVRMTCMYGRAAELDSIVIGTSNRSELLLGYFTKYGDGGSDVCPIGALYKGQVRELAKHMKLPERIIDKPPSAGLWEGQTDEGEIGLDYDSIDAILSLLVDGKKSKGEVVAAGFSDDSVSRVEEMVQNSAHKRQMPPVISLE